MGMTYEQIPLGAKPPQHELFKQHFFGKTKLCKFFAMNQCRHGDQCNFAHGSEKLEALPDLRKTSICKDWRQGACPLQTVDCPFAHGRTELRRTEVYMHKVNGFGERNLLDKTKVDSKQEVNELFHDKTMFDKYGTGSTRSGSVPIDAEPIKVGPMESLASVSIFSNSIPINAEPIKVTTTPSLQGYAGPSAMFCDMPFEYSKKILTVAPL